MKRSLLLLIWLILTASIWGQDYLSADYEHFCSHKMKQAFQKVSTLDINQSPLLDNYDVKFYFLDLEVENNTTYLSGEVSISAQVTVNVLDTFAFELIDELFIDQVFVNEIEHSVIHENNEAFIPLTEPILLHSNFSVKVNTMEHLLSVNHFQEFLRNTIPYGTSM